MAHGPINMENQNKLPVIIILSLLFFAVTFFITKINYDLATPDSGAIVGGKLETGYPFAGFLISELNSGNKVNICGASYLSSNIIITAAHCLNDISRLDAGIGQFKTDPAKNFASKSFLINPNWTQSDTITDIGQSKDDIAIVQLATPAILDEYSNIVEPQLGCNYEVIGYGRSEATEVNSLTRERKSAELCIEEVSDFVLLVRGKDGGICHGDSGSPIYEKGTNNLVGLMSASQLDENGNCDLNNLAIVVRVDAQKAFIDDFTNKIKPITSLRECGEMDIDSDETFTIIDFLGLVDIYGKECENKQASYVCGSRDLNEDGVVNILDLQMFQDGYRKISCKQ
jgi:hypothetical protein